MEIITNIYNNCRLVLQQYGSSFSGIYLTIILLLIFWVLFDEKSNLGILFRYACTCLISILIICIVTIFKTVDGVNGNPDIYMILPVMTLIILLCVFIGRKNEIKSKYIVIIFVFLIICEASVPLRISVKSSFTIPNKYGKYSSVAEEIYSIVGEESVVLPSSLEMEYRALKWDGTLTEEDVYDDGEGYLISNTYTEVIDSAVQNDRMYVVIRYTNMLGSTNVDTIKESVIEKGYKVDRVVGKYVIAKKES